MLAKDDMSSSLVRKLRAQWLLRALRSSNVDRSTHAANQLAQMGWRDAIGEIVAQMKRRDAYQGTLLKALHELDADREQLVEGCLNWMAARGMNVAVPVQHLAGYGGSRVAQALEEKRGEFIAANSAAVRRGNGFMGSGPRQLEQSIASVCRALHDLTGYVGRWQSVVNEQANAHVPKGRKPISAKDTDLTIAFIIASDEWLASFESYESDEDICIHFHVANESRQRGKPSDA